MYIWQRYSGQKNFLAWWDDEKLALTCTGHIDFAFERETTAWDNFTWIPIVRFWFSTTRRIKWIENSRV